ncbi:MAG: flagellar biosynthesis anti-sigma factor FlgM [Candidatus Delongbacteria bacterium]
MEIQSGSLSQVGQALRRAAIETRYQTTRQLEQAGGAAAQEDRLEISSSGLELSRLRSSLQTQAAQLPEIREERVALARQRVAAGFYDREEIVAQISDRMMEDSSLGETAATGNGTVPAAPYRDELMREVETKIHSGFYTDNDVMSFVADRLMDIYQIKPQDEA